MTTFHLEHDGDDYRIEISDERFVMLRQRADGIWNVEARMSVRSAEMLAAMDLTKLRPSLPGLVSQSSRQRNQKTTAPGLSKPVRRTVLQQPVSRWIDSTDRGEPLTVNGTPRQSVKFGSRCVAVHHSLTCERYRPVRGNAFARVAFSAGICI